MKNDPVVVALLAEREGYLRRGLKNRVAEVDKALQKHNIAVDDKVEVAAVEPEVEVAAAPKRTKKVSR